MRPSRRKLVGTFRIRPRRGDASSVIIFLPFAAIRHKTPSTTFRPSSFAPPRSPGLCREERFDLDLAKLDANFRGKQRAVHPDKFGQLSPEEQALSAAASSAMNIAYNALRDPVSRAEALIETLRWRGSGGGAAGASGGLDAPAEKASPPPPPPPDPSLLEEIMEARELLADSSTTPEQVQQLSLRVEKAVRDCIADMTRAFASGSVPLATEIAVALRYYSALKADITEWGEPDARAKASGL